MVTKTHRHLHINVQRTMARAKITADMERAFHGGTDTIGMCELETAWHHGEFKRCAEKYGYSIVLPQLGKPGSALGIAVKDTYGAIVYSHVTFAAPGQKHVSPHRYILRTQVKRHADQTLVSVAETHQYSSGWTGAHSLDALRKARWHIGMLVVRRVERRATKHNEVVIGAGDLNRPPYSFRGGKVLPGLLSKTGMASTGYAHTDHTHGGVTFDYAWFLSKNHTPKVQSWSTPAFASDHDGIVMNLSWESK